MLQGAPGAYRDTVLLNAAAALIVAGRAADLREGVALAERSHRIRRRLRRVGNPAAGERRRHDVLGSRGNLMADDIGSMPDVLARICTDMRAEVAVAKDQARASTRCGRRSRRGMIRRAVSAMR